MDFSHELSEISAKTLRTLRCMVAGLGTDTALTPDQRAGIDNLWSQIEAELHRRAVLEAQAIVTQFRNSVEAL